MSLSEITIPSKTIEFNGGSFEVWAVSVEVLAFLSNDFKQELRDLFVTTKAAGEKNVDAMDVSQHFIQRAPAFVASLIAAAAHEPEHVERVAKLPLPVQLEAFTAIIDLTVSSSGGLKKCLEQVMDAMQMATSMMNDAGEALQSH